MNVQATKQKRRSRGIYLLPNLFTIAALFAGFYAIVSGMNARYSHAAVAIFIAMVMDSLDGRVARLTNTQTEFGAQLDSLSDMVSFGVAPALVAYTWGLSNLGKIGWLSAFIFAVAGALRLARFNVQGGSGDDAKRYFRGLPIPAAAANIAGLIWLSEELGFVGKNFSIVVAVFTVLVGLLMVTNIRYRSFKDLDLKGRVSFMMILTVVLIFVLISIDPPQVLFITFFGYALSGPLNSAWRHYRRTRQG